MPIRPPQGTATRTLGGVFLALLGTLAAPTTAQQPAGKRKVVTLQPARFQVAEELPLAVRQRLLTTLTKPLVDIDVPVRRGEKQLEVDLDRNGSFETRVVQKKPACVEVATTRGKQPILLAHDGLDWFAAPAVVLTGKVDQTRVMFLDGDADGVFVGGNDWARYADGAFFRLVPDLPLLGDGRGLARYSLRTDGKTWQLELQELAAEPHQNALQWRALLANNSFRNTVGLPPTQLDRQRSDGAQKHAEYLKRNNYDYSKPWDGVGSHGEDPSKPGYTPEGASAGSDHATAGTSDAAGCILSMTATMLHRISFLGPALGGLGVGAVQGADNPSADGYCVVGGPAPAPRSLLDIVLVPAPGQRSVPLLVKSERPPVEVKPDFYESPRGYPVSVTFGSLPVSTPAMRVWTARGQAVSGDSFSPEHPVHSTRPQNERTLFFVADKPLQPETDYVAEFTAKHAGEDVRLRWTFRTQ